MKKVKNEFKVILTKDDVIFENKDGDTMWVGQKTIPIKLDPNDPVLRMASLRMGVEVFEILQCFDKGLQFFEK